MGQEGWEDIAISFDSNVENRQLIDGKVDFISRLIAMHADQKSEGFLTGGNSRRRKGESNDVFVARVLAGGYKEVRRKQAALARVAYQLQYSLIEVQTASKRPEVARKRSSTGDLMDDAYDIAMRRVLGIHAGRDRHDRTSHYVQCSLLTGGPQELQTADWCSSTNSLQDPYKPSAYSNGMYKG